MTELVAVERVNRSVQEAVERGLENFELSIKPETRIVIKPNLCCVRTCETGATTDPQIVEALIKYFRSHFGSKKFYIVESDATSLNADVAFQILGYSRLAQKIKANVVNLSKIPWELKSFPDTVLQTSIHVPKFFKRPHFLISVAKMKTHDICGLSTTLKNVFGCNPEPYKLKYHIRLHQNIVDFASAFKPSLSIVDAIVAMEGMGPISGTPIPLGAMLFGTDPVATDHAAATVMRINPCNVKHLEIARQQGIGNFKYKVAGISLSEIATSFKRTLTITRTLYSSRFFHLLSDFTRATFRRVTPRGYK